MRTLENTGLHSTRVRSEGCFSNDEVTIVGLALKSLNHARQAIATIEQWSIEMDDRAHAEVGPSVRWKTPSPSRRKNGMPEHLSCLGIQLQGLTEQGCVSSDE